MLLALLVLVMAACRDEGGSRPESGKRQGEATRAEFEALARRLKAGSNEYLGRQPALVLEQELAAGGVRAGRRLTLLVRLAVERLRLGEVDAAEAAMTTAGEMLARARVPAATRAQFLEVRALVHLRRAELENCILRHRPACCIFPLEGEGLHTLTDPGRAAFTDYLELAGLRPGDLAVRWLLNLAAMTVDAREEVPARLRLPQEAFRSEQPFPRFVDVASGIGVDDRSLCGGCVVDDLDGDGRLDVVVSNFDPEGPLVFHRADGRGGFEDRSVASGLADQLGGLNLIGADYDGDGDVDLLVLRGAWLHEAGRIRNSLLRNDGEGNFTDVTREAGLAEPARPTQAAAFGDFDGDGDLDLFIGNESRKALGHPREDHPCQLFRNEGDGRFVDVAAAAGVTNDRFCKGVAAGDYDDDGDLDLYVSNVGPNRLYRNDGGLRFTDVTEEAGVAEPSDRSFATWFFDYDNDGRLDLFCAAYDATIADVCAHALGRPDEATRPRLYRNLGGGRFVDVARTAGLDRPVLPMGANFGDLDNDGWLDIYLATGDPDYRTLMPSLMLRNDRGRRFRDVTRAGGFGHLQKGHGVAFADLDDDGDQDVYHQLGGFFPGDAYPNALFENPGFDNRWVVLQLEGGDSPRCGHGARIRVDLRTPTGPRSLHRAVGSVSSFGGSPRRQEIGLGPATAIEKIVVKWPRSASPQVITGPPMERLLILREGAKEAAVRTLEPRPFR